MIGIAFALLLARDGIGSVWESCAREGVAALAQSAKAALALVAEGGPGLAAFFKPPVGFR